MHADSIGLQNFQGFSGMQSVDLAPLTIIFGPNASGKSSIARALKLLKQSSNSTSGDFNYTGREIDLKSRRYVTYSQGEDLELGVGFTVAIDHHNPANYGLKSVGTMRFVSKGSISEKCFLKVAGPNESEDFSYYFELTEKGEAAEFGISNLESAERHFRALMESEEMIRALFYIPTNADLYQDEAGVHWTLQENEEGEEFMLSVDGDERRLPSPEFRLVGNFVVEGYQRPTETSWDALWSEFESKFLIDTPNLSIWLSREDEFPNPELADRVELLNAIMTLSKSITSAYLSELDATQSVRPLQEEVSSNPTVKPVDSVNKWLERLTGGRYSVVIDQEPAFDKLFTSTNVQDSVTGAQVNFENVGTGLSQILPILEALDVASSALIIEQPELHLHPKMQGDLADIFIDALQSDSGPSQILIETHSENILLRVQRRIREGKLRAIDVRIVYCEQENEWFDLERLTELGNDPVALMEAMKDFMSPSESPSAEALLATSLPRGLFERMERDLKIEIHLGDRGFPGNRMVNLELDSAGDVLDPFPISFVDLRLTDLLL